MMAMQMSIRYNVKFPAYQANWLIALLEEEISLLKSNMFCIAPICNLDDLHKIALKIECSEAVILRIKKAKPNTVKPKLGLPRKPCKRCGGYMGCTGGPSCPGAY